jgi:hypothetical protein
MWCCGGRRGLEGVGSVDQVDARSEVRKSVDASRVGAVVVRCVGVEWGCWVVEGVGVEMGWWLVRMKKKRNEEGGAGWLKRSAVCLVHTMCCALRLASTR